MKYLVSTLILCILCSCKHTSEIAEVRLSEYHIFYFNDIPQEDSDALYETIEEKKIERINFYSDQRMKLSRLSIYLKGFWEKGIEVERVNIPVATPNAYFRNPHVVSPDGSQIPLADYLEMQKNQENE